MPPCRRRVPQRPHRTHQRLLIANAPRAVRRYRTAARSRTMRAIWLGLDRENFAGLEARLVPLAHGQARAHRQCSSGPKGGQYDVDVCHTCDALGGGRAAVRQAPFRSRGAGHAGGTCAPGGGGAGTAGVRGEPCRLLPVGGRPGRPFLLAVRDITRRTEAWRVCQRAVTAHAKIERDTPFESAASAQHDGDVASFFRRTPAARGTSRRRAVRGRGAHIRRAADGRHRQNRR